MIATGQPEREKGPLPRHSGILASLRSVIKLYSSVSLHAQIKNGRAKRKLQGMLFRRSFLCARTRSRHLRTRMRPNITQATQKLGGGSSPPSPVVAKVSSGAGIKFYRIPHKEPNRTLWLNAINRKNFQPRAHTVICSQHFVGG